MWISFHGDCIIQTCSCANSFQIFDVQISPAVLLEGVRHKESLNVFFFAISGPGSATYNLHLLYRLGQIAVNPKQCLSSLLDHFSLAQVQAIGKLFTDHG